jgi:hypothetical protein
MIKYNGKKYYSESETRNMINDEVGKIIITVLVVMLILGCMLRYKSDEVDKLRIEVNQYQIAEKEGK